MTQATYDLLEAYMIRCMADSAHDKEHIYRVLYNALEIAGQEETVDLDVLIAACLLHDIGRSDQFADPSVCHAEAGSRKAYEFLLAHGFDRDFAEKVSSCILTHRFRKSRPPQSMEAKILFDADKLDVTGAIGIARTLMYKADMDEPIYCVLPDGTIGDGTEQMGQCFFREYKCKLEKLYGSFYTARGAQIAQQRQMIAASFYESLYREVNTGYLRGKQQIKAILRDY